MASIGPRLPLERDLEDGYVMHKTLRETIKQNFKNLVLTSPGERMMDPAFGVGIRNFFFEQNTPELAQGIRQAVNRQVQQYMSFLQVKNIGISFNDDTQALDISIEYYVPGVNVLDRLSLDSTLRNSEIQTI